MASVAPQPADQPAIRVEAAPAPIRQPLGEAESRLFQGLPEQPPKPVSSRKWTTGEKLMTAGAILAILGTVGGIVGVTEGWDWAANAPVGEETAEIITEAMTAAAITGAVTGVIGFAVNKNASKNAIIKQEALEIGRAKEDRRRTVTNAIARRDAAYNSFTSALVAMRNPLRDDSGEPVPIDAALGQQFDAAHRLMRGALDRGDARGASQARFLREMANEAIEAEKFAIASALDGCPLNLTDRLEEQLAQTQRYLEGIPPGDHRHNAATQLVTWTELQVDLSKVSGARAFVPPPQPRPMTPELQASQFDFGELY
jgi:hypothetical protein